MEACLRGSTGIKRGNPADFYQDNAIHGASKRQACDLQVEFASLFLTNDFSEFAQRTFEISEIQYRLDGQLSNTFEALAQHLEKIIQDHTEDQLRNNWGSNLAKIIKSLNAFFHRGVACEEQQPLFFCVALFLNDIEKPLLNSRELCSVFSSLVDIPPSEGVEKMMNAVADHIGARAKIKMSTVQAIYTKLSTLLSTPGANDILESLKKHVFQFELIDIVTALSKLSDLKLGWVMDGLLIMFTQRMTALLQDQEHKPLFLALTIYYLSSVLQTESVPVTKLVSSLLSDNNLPYDRKNLHLAGEQQAIIMDLLRDRRTLEQIDLCDFPPSLAWFYLNIIFNELGQLKLPELQLMYGEKIGYVIYKKSTPSQLKIMYWNKHSSHSSHSFVYERNELRSAVLKAVLKNEHFFKRGEWLGKYFDDHLVLTRSEQG